MEVKVAGSSAQTREDSVGFEVLLVEDDRTDAELVRRALPPEWRVVHVGSVSAAAAQLERRDWHAVLLDWHLPDGNSAPILEACAGTHLPVVVLTSAGPIVEAERILELGALEFMDKSTIERRTLTASIATARSRSLSIRRLLESRADASALRVAARLTHDLSNSMMAMGGGLDILGEQLEDASPDTRTVLQQLTKASRHAAETTRELVGHMQGSRENTRLTEVGRIVFTTLRLLPPSYGERVRVQLPDDPLWVIARGNALVRVLFNLIKNAKEANRESRDLSIEVQAMRAGNKIHLSVVDSGPGLPASVVRRFGHRIASNKPGLGRGLGLASCAFEVDQMGGSFGVECVGDRFYPTLSLKAPRFHVVDPGYTTNAVVALSGRYRWRTRVEVALSAAYRCPVMPPALPQLREAFRRGSRVVLVADRHGIDDSHAELVRRCLSTAADIEIVSLEFDDEPVEARGPHDLAPPLPFAVDEQIVLRRPDDVTTWWLRHPG